MSPNTCISQQPCLPSVTQSFFLLCFSSFFFTFFASSSHLWPLQSEKARTEHTSSYCTTRCPPFPPSIVYSIFRRIASRTYLYKHIPCRRILLNIFSRFALLGRQAGCEATNTQPDSLTHAHTVILTYLVCSRLYNSAAAAASQNVGGDPQTDSLCAPSASALGSTLFILLHCVVVVAFYLFFVLFFFSSSAPSIPLGNNNCVCVCV